MSRVVKDSMFRRDIGDRWCPLGVLSGTKCSLSKFMGGTKLSGAAVTPEGRGGIQRDLDKLQTWPMGFQQGQVQGPAAGSGQPLVPTEAGE